ncbi:unnamed protein product [uncultured bacterium]|nr:unnamed protein product [uncultured bacterium]
MIADEVWRRFGNVKSYVEPFASFPTTLLARPDWQPGIWRHEMINDMDGMLCNFWRAMTDDQKCVARHAAIPASKRDLRARNLWLTGRRESIGSRLEGDPEWYDPKIAGWWVWAMNRKLGGVPRSIPSLATRLRYVGVASGHWSRICTDVFTKAGDLTGVFLAPAVDGGIPTDRYGDRWSTDLPEAISKDVRTWAVERGNDPLLRIALCGYEGEHKMPKDWLCHDQVRSKKRIWFSPHCRQSVPVRVFL